MNTQTFREFLMGLLAAATAALSPQAQAAETIGSQVVDGIEWNFVVRDDAEATVGLGKSTLTAIFTNTAGAVTVPATLGGVPVTAIGDYAFYGCTNVTSFALPGSVTSIGSNAFRNCRSATAISVPNAVTNFGEYAFAGCSALQECAIPPLVEELPDFVFRDCVSFREVVVPETVRSVGSGAFSSCTGLVNATVRASEGIWAATSTEGASGVFYDCSLETLTISCPVVGGGSLYRCRANRLVLEEGVESIEKWAFWSSRFGSVSFPDSLTRIDQNAFRGYSGGAATLPYTTGVVPGVRLLDGWAVACVASNTTGALDLSGVRGILGGCFRGKDYESVSMPDIRVLGERCFENCMALQSVSIGKNLKAVQYSQQYGYSETDDYELLTAGPFTGCTRLKRAVLEEGTGKVFDGLFAGCTGLENITLPGSVACIGSNAFADCTGLAQIAFPSGLTDIGYSAFEGCRALTQVVLPSSVTNIGDCAFQNCSGLTAVAIPDGVERLYYSFYGCKGLESVFIPASATNIMGAFEGCTGIRSATVPGTIPLSTLLPGSYRGITSVELVEGTSTICDSMFYNCTGLSSVAIRGGVTNIGRSAFANCSALASVNIPNSVTDIGDSAFYKCSALTLLDIPNRVKDIGNSAFSGCSNLVNIAIPGSVTRLGQAAFNGCNGLTSAKLGAGVQEIGPSAFFGCSSLASLSMPASLARIGESAFYNCSALTDVSLTDLAAWCSVLFGNATASPFYYARNLLLGNEGELAQLVMALEIPDGVASIGDYAFYNCDCLESVSIPDSVKAIGKQAFYGCDNLVRMRVPQAVMAQGLSSVFRGSYRNLQQLSLGADVDAIGADEFNGAMALADIDVAEGNANYRVLPDGCLYDAGLTTLLVCPRDATAVDLPDGLETISPYAFQNCGALSSLVFPETVASIPASVLDGCEALWTKWYKTLSNLAEGGGAPGGSGKTVSLAITNVVVHYVTQSVPSAAVTPGTNSTGIVNIVAEVTAPKAIAISEDWAKQYPGFAAKYGTDFSAALTMPDGKRDGTGAPMQVWQDYVAGTDPTEPTSVFTASVTFDAETGEPVISWSPELPPEEAAKRLYTLYGKARMTDPDWLPLAGDASACNFFRVTVEMK